MSIHENELRKGVNAMAAGLPITITEIRSEGVFAYFRKGSEDSYFKFKEIDPIPITNEILLAVGFERNWLDELNHDEGEYYTCKINDEKFCDLSIISGDKNGVLEICLFPYESWFRYKYLHQLQNLIFSLTGKEIEYSPSIK